MGGAIRFDFRHKTDALRDSGVPRPMVLSDSTTLGELRQILVGRYPLAKPSWLAHGVGFMIRSIGGIPRTGRYGFDDAKPRRALIGHFQGLHPQSIYFLYELVLALLGARPAGASSQSPAAPKTAKPAPRPRSTPNDFYDADTAGPMATPPAGYEPEAASPSHGLDAPLDAPPAKTAGTKRRKAADELPV